LDQNLQERFDKSLPVYFFLALATHPVKHSEYALLNFGNTLFDIAHSLHCIKILNVFNTGSYIQIPQSLFVGIDFILASHTLFKLSAAKASVYWHVF
jgi:hypothetical protein